MDANSWLWVAIIAFLVFCCLPMLFMGRHDKHSSHNPRSDDGGQSSDPRDKTTGAE